MLGEGQRDEFDPAPSLRRAHRSVKDTVKERGNSKYGGGRLLQGSEERLGDLAGVSQG